MNVIQITYILPKPWVVYVYEGPFDGQDMIEIGYDMTLNKDKI